MSAHEPAVSSIPRIVHYVYGFQPQDTAFHILHYAAIRSALDVIKPDRLLVHVHNLPWGVYWDAIRPFVELRRITPCPALGRVPVDPDVEPYRYAHYADIARLDVLLEHGGLYCDIDTIWVRCPPDDFWTGAAVLGREADVVHPATGVSQASLTNAVILSPPAGRFLARWRAQIVDAMDGSWSAHSCQLAYRLAQQHPQEVRVADQSAFAAFPHSVEGMAMLLEHDTPIHEEVLAVHWCQHLWWQQGRSDFSRVHAGQLNAQTLREGSFTLARLARPHLPTNDPLTGS
jgi:hypothetical protein